MSAAKVTVECMGGPMHGRKVTMSTAARFVSIPFATGDTRYSELMERWTPVFGQHNYERIGSLAFYAETLR